MMIIAVSWPLVSHKQPYNDHVTCDELNAQTHVLQVLLCIDSNPRRQWEGRRWTGGEERDIRQVRRRSEEARVFEKERVEEFSSGYLKGH